MHRRVKRVKVPARVKTPQSKVYETSKTEWESRKNEPDKSWLFYDLPKVIPANDVLSTLEQLYEWTNDQRYRDLANGVTGVMDRKTDNWAGWHTLDDPWHNPSDRSVDSYTRMAFTRMVCEIILENIATCMTEREAIAAAVANFNIRASSFDTACKQVKRVLDEYRKLKDFL
jgi:hypothetical protein